MRSAGRRLALGLVPALQLALVGAAVSSCDRAGRQAAPAARKRPAQLAWVTLKALGIT